MRKKFKTKKRFKFKKTIYLLFIIFLIFISIFYISKIKLLNSNKKLISGILNNINYYSYNDIDDSSISRKIMKYINNNIFNSPINLLESELNYIYQEKENIEKVEFSYEENDLPLVYIYNSHQGETYSTTYLEDYNIVPDVIMASYMLEDKLEKIGISSIVEQSDILEYMNQNNLNHAGSYIASRHYLENTINKYPSIKLFIDLHRDAATHSVTHTNIEGKDCAKVLFVIGLEYSTYEANLSVVTKINNIIQNKYSSLTRGIMKKQGYGVNGVYNQDLNNNVILIEIGGHENNIDEVNNTLDIIANVIGEYLNEKE